MNHYLIGRGNIYYTRGPGHKFMHRWSPATQPDEGRSGARPAGERAARGLEGLIGARWPLQYAS